jgi:hypothetical protein
VLREEAGQKLRGTPCTGNATDTTQRIGPIQILLKRQLDETTCSMLSLSYDNVKCRHLVMTFTKRSLCDNFLKVVTKWPLF